MSSVQHASGSVVDVSSIIPRERHPLIFNTFHELEPGEYKGTFPWNYLDQGPDVRRVRISRTA